MIPSNSSPGVRTADRLGVVGQSLSLAELTTIKWDAIVVGAGHNGLVCATYLARHSKRVLVLESRERVGGACTLEETWPGYKISPCAYVAGLLHPWIINELDMRSYGFEWMAAHGGLFVPFEDGSSIQLWDDEQKCLDEIKRFSPDDLAGWREMHHFMQDVCDKLRPVDDRDLWIGPAPTREQIEERLEGDADAISFLFDWSMDEFLSRYLKSEKLQLALMGQGVVGTFASPFDPGTASIYFHHYCGRMDERNPGAWGYVKGGMGMVSFILCDIARDTGVTICTGLPVLRIIPGVGVELLEGGRITAPIIVSNADPKSTAFMLGPDCDPEWRKRVDAVPMKGCTLKVNAALSDLPDFTARPGKNQPHHLATINTPLSKDEWRAGFAAVQNGRLPGKLWSEIYLQTAYDASVAPEGKHVMSVFAQYVPYEFAQGDWSSRREEAGKLCIESIARFCPDLPSSIIAMDVLGPPDVES